ncbi:hypothetical protein QD46_19005 [Paenibacillus polymyxa]|uniref:hypothetical protein n=1 Tax=Paenibacillus polymyxa TaxID=1406 RepID=UPI0005CE0C6C|nr:hypothetical protein [Paenibacillus polymyxa]KJD38544.1 hypothetical protein QD46_19005 [Paenibacillus polymyxa]
MQSVDHQLYLAESHRIPKLSMSRYIQYFNINVKPFLEQCMVEHTIQGYEVYRFRLTAEKRGEFDSWNFLLLLQVESKSVAEQYVKLKQQLIGFPKEIEVRSELMISTPQSNYPTPPQHVQRRAFKPFFAVEYVDVQAPYLDEFRHIMIHNNGPAMRNILEHKKWCFMMIALETLEVWYHHHAFPTWNQIHIIGLYPEAMLHYKKDFEEGLQQHAGVTFQENFDRLKSIRTMLYKTIASRLFPT